jgi:hypothetical protein
MKNCTRVANVRNYSPLGVIALPFDHAGGFLGPSGTSSTPAPNVNYTVRGTDVLLGVSGGDGAVLTIMDADGAVFSRAGMSQATPPLALPVGWAVSFGGFTAAPKVMVGGS